MLPITPLFHTFPIVSLTPFVYIFAIFTFKPIHDPSIGISRILSDKYGCSTQILTEKGGNLQNNTIRTSDLKSLSNSLPVGKRGSPGCNVSVDFPKSWNGGNLFGLFTESGLVGMLEGADFNFIDMVSTFMVAIIDHCCDYIVTSHETNVLRNISNQKTLYFVYIVHPGGHRSSCTN